MTSGEYTVGSLFAGIGGICLGFRESGCTISWANEMDKYACMTYRNNLDLIGDTDLVEGDIRDFVPKEEVTILTGGFPCQPYSNAGLRGGLDDGKKRGRPMFDEILRIAKVANPRVIFLENVGHLKNFDNKHTFSVLMKLLEETGYELHEDFVLNSKDHSGIAQFRNRIYIVAFRDEKDHESFKSVIGDGPKKIPVKRDLKTIVDTKKEAPSKYYYSDCDRGKCISIRFKEHFVPCVTDKDTIYQYRRNFMRANKNHLCPALTASMGSGGHNVPIILDDFGIRKLTPEECLGFQGFPDDYSFPEGMADTHKYKQSGNSVTVPVIFRMAEYIVAALRKTDSMSKGLE